MIQINQLNQNIEQTFSKQLALVRPSNTQDFKWQQVTGLLSQPQQAIIQVQERKPFDYKQQFGHIWYKNMNIPQIKVSIQENISLQIKKENKIFVKLFILRQQIENKKTFIMPVNGEDSQKLTLGECEFQGLRFTTTSYSHKGSRYFIIVSLFEQEGDNIRQLSNFQVSPAIYVESRKKAFLERQTYSSLFTPFSSDKLEKKLLINEEISQDTEEGSLKQLHDFLVNPRIRQKIFHPIYLFMKFYPCLTFYLNNKLIDKYQEESVEFFSDIQKQMDRIIKKSESKKNKKSYQLTDKLMIITVKRDQNTTDNDIERIMKILNCLEGPILTILSSHGDQLPQQFEELIYNDQMITQYSKCQFQQNVKQQQLQTCNSSLSTQISNYEESENNLEDSYQSKKKVKSNKFQSVQQQQSQVSVFDLSSYNYSEKQKQNLDKIVIQGYQKHSQEEINNYNKQKNQQFLCQNYQSGNSNTLTYIPQQQQMQIQQQQIKQQQQLFNQYMTKLEPSIETLPNSPYTNFNNINNMQQNFVLNNIASLSNLQYI